MDDIFAKKTQPEPDKFIRKYRNFLNKALVPAVSITIHLVLLALLSFWVFYTPKPPEPKFNIIGMTDIKIPELKTVLAPEELLQKETAAVKRSGASGAQPSKTSDANAAADHSEALPKVVHPELPRHLFSAEPASAVGNFDGGFMALGNAATLSGIGTGNTFSYRNRGRGGTGKRGSSSGSGTGPGGSELSKDEKKIDEAVIKALTWLKENQNGDGSWGNGLNPDLRNGISSLAVLAFLAHGETPYASEFGGNVKAGLKNLLGKSGGYSSGGFAGGFGEALLTYVLAEGASVTQVPELMTQSRNRAALVCRQLGRQGIASQGDTLTAWNYQALKAAIFAVPSPEFSTAAVAGAKTLLMQHREQSSGILGKKSKPAKESELDEVFQRSYCLQLFGYIEHPTVRKYLDLAGQYNKKSMLSCNWSMPPEWPLYAWYYRTNALFFVSGGHGHEWLTWYRNMTDTLLEHQNQDGSFVSPEASNKGDKSGENAQTFTTENDLTVYSTAMAALILQGKYRYLPSYCAVKSSPKEISFADPATEKEIGITALFEKNNIEH